MTIGYKLVDQNGYTRRDESGETHWAAGATVSPVGKGDDPCGPGVLHYYKSDLLAALLNPVHANIANPRLLVVEHNGPEYTDGTKCWTTAACRVVLEIALPELSVEQRVYWAILCAREACDDPKWIVWADGWLSGADRSESSAWAAGGVAAWAAEEAVRAAVATGAAGGAARIAGGGPVGATWWAAETAAWGAETAGEMMKATESARAAQIATRVALRAATGATWGAYVGVDIAATAERMLFETI